MKFILILLTVATVAFVAWRFKWKPIENWRNAFRCWSTWIHGTGLVSALAPFLGVWNQMPMAVQRVVPGSLLLGIGLTLWAAGALAVYVKQEKLHGPQA